MLSKATRAEAAVDPTPVKAPDGVAAAAVADMALAAESAEHAPSTTTAAAAAPAKRDAGSWVPEVEMADAEEEEKKNESLPKDAQVEPTDAATTAALTPAAATASSSSLYNDAVQSVLSFLPLSDVKRCMMVNTQWRNVVGHMASLHRTYCVTNWNSAHALGGLCASPLTRHIGGLCGRRRHMHGLPDRLCLDSDDLNWLVLQLPQLRVLQCGLTSQDSRCGSGFFYCQPDQPSLRRRTRSWMDPPPPPEAFVFPPHLHTLDLHIWIHHSFRLRHAAMLGIGALAALERLTLRVYIVYEKEEEQGDRLFQPLLQLQKLNTFKFHIQRTSREKRSNRGNLLLAADIDCLRRMPALTRLSLLHPDRSSNEPVRLLAELTAQPHTLKLRDVHLTASTLDDGALLALSRVPSLTRLTPASVRLTDIYPLASLTNLTDLRLKSVDPTVQESAVDGDALMAALRPLKQLTQLEMSCQRLAPVHLAWRGACIHAHSCPRQARGGLRAVALAVRCCGLASRLTKPLSEV